MDILVLANQGLSRVEQCAQKLICSLGQNSEQYAEEGGREGERPHVLRSLRIVLLRDLDQHGAKHFSR